MNWEKLLSLKRFGDTKPRVRNKQDETRLGFEVDFDRIIFSNSFRSLQDKTQVIPLSKTDFVHTRLTHSLEVSVVARTLGRKVGAEVLKKHPNLVEKGYKINDFGAITAAAALAHDIGNPPFGHSGEKAIGEYFKTGNGQKYKAELSAKQWQDLIDFEGNANGFKLLNQTQKGMQGGLRLSYATLGAFTKYPKESLPKKPTSHIADKKYGIFQSEKKIFSEIASELGLKKEGEKEKYYRHPLAYLVEAADDICYTIIDLEDGINLGLIEEKVAFKPLEDLVKDTINLKKYQQLAHKKNRLSYLRALAIGNLINEAVKVFNQNEEAILNGTFTHALLDKCKYETQINHIIKLSIAKIYQSKEVIEKEILGYSVIAKLLDVFTTAQHNSFNNTTSNYDKLIITLLPENLQKPKETVYERLLEICGYVASLTDGYALQLYKKING